MVSIKHHCSECESKYKIEYDENTISKYLEDDGTVFSGHFHLQRFMEENHIKSVNTYKTGLEELIRYNLLCPTSEAKKGYYWINPRLFFCGNRPNKYPNNIEIYSTKG